MPLLLLISGFLLGLSLQSGGSLVPRIAMLGWLFTCWSLLTWSIFALIHGETPNPETFLWEFVAPTTPLWFIWALGLMTIAMAVVPRSKRIFLLLAALAASMASHAGLVHFEVFPIDRAIENGVFFFLGATYPALLQRLMNTSPLRALTVALPLLALTRLADSAAVELIGGKCSDCRSACWRALRPCRCAP